ncbi:MAG TPA: carboxypeptidase-like regulatory domain-containing protein, partial [Gemmatimonadaceae bacterium]
IDSTVMPPLRLVVPTLAARVKAYCKQGVVSGPGTTLLLGNVLLSDASNASGAQVEAFWGESGLDIGRGFREHARTDTSGAFHICGLVGEDTVLIKGTLDSVDAFGEVSFRSHRDSLLMHVTLRLTVPPFRARVVRVVDERGDPIRGASLIDDETGEARMTTNIAGEASLGWLPRGRSSVPVQRTGYEPARVTVNVTPNDTTTVTVRMRRAP